MDAELVETHLQQNKDSGNSNRRNDKTNKTVPGINTGTFTLESSQDRFCTFEPELRRLIIEN